MGRVDAGLDAADVTLSTSALNRVFEREYWGLPSSSFLSVVLGQPYTVLTFWSQLP